MATLYGAQGVTATTSDLYTIDSTTGTPTSVGPIGFALTALAFDPTDGTLYGVTSNNSASNPRSLITVNPATGVGTLIGALGIGSASLRDIAITSDGTIWGIASSGNNLYTVNKGTGTATSVATISIFPAFDPFNNDSFCGIDGLTTVGTHFVYNLQQDGSFTTIHSIATNASSNSAGAASFGPDGKFYVIDTNVSGLHLFTAAMDGTIATIGPTLNKIDALAWDTQARPSPPGISNNDLFANATLISGTSGNIAGDNTGYTSDGIHDPLATLFAYGSKTAWYKWVCPSTGYYDYWTSGPGTLTDTTLAVMQDTGGGIAGLLVGWVDDDNDSGLGTHATGFYSEVPLLHYVSGTTYYIEVAGFHTGSGGFTLNWATTTAPASPPANDDFVNATVVAGDIFSSSGSTVDSTREFGEPNPDAVFNGAWVKWTAPRTGQARVSITAATNFIHTDVWQGVSVSSLTQVVSNTVAGIGPVSSLFSSMAGNLYYMFSFVSGQTYYFRMQSKYESYTLSLLMESATPPANDDFANAIDITGPLSIGLPTVASTGMQDVDINGATLENGEQNSLPIALEPDPKMSIWWTFTLTQPGMFSLQLLQGLPGDLPVFLSPSLAGRFELWSGDSLGNLGLLQTWRIYPVTQDIETICIGSGTYYLRAATNNWGNNVQFRYRIAYSTIQIKVGEIDAGTSLISTGFLSKVTGLILYSTGLDTNTQYEENFVVGLGACDQDLNQFGSSGMRLYERTGVTDTGHGSFSTGRVIQIIDPALPGSSSIEGVVDSFNSNGSISLSWPTLGAAAKIGYWAVCNIDTKLVTSNLTFAGGSFVTSTDWKVKASWGAAGYFDPFSVDGGSAGHLPNAGASASVGGAFGSRSTAISGPNETDTVVASGSGGGGGGFSYLDGGTQDKGVNELRGTNDGITFSWSSGEPGHDDIPWGSLQMGGLGWTAAASVSPMGEVGGFPANYHMAGALAQAVGSVSFPVVFGDPINFPYPGHPGEARGDIGNGEWMAMGAWDLDSNQWVGLAGGRDYNTLHSADVHFSDSPHFRNWFNDRVATALDDYGSMPWYRTISITDDQHGTTASHGSEPTGASSSFVIFFALCALPLGVVSFSHIKSGQRRAGLQIR